MKNKSLLTNCIHELNSMFHLAGLISYLVHIKMQPFQKLSGKHTRIGLDSEYGPNTELFSF